MAKHSPFSAEICDKIRKTHRQGKKTIEVKGRKYDIRSAAKRGYLLIKPSDGSMVPMANIESSALQKRNDNRWRKDMQDHHAAKKASQS